jgi:hypothetical protein
VFIWSICGLYFAGQVARALQVMCNWMMLYRRTGWAIAAICLIAFAAVAILSDQVFEKVPHSEDEVAYIFQAKVFAQNRLTVPTPSVDYAFWTPFVVDYQGARFGKYPPGWPLLLSLGVRLGMPWLVNAFLAMLTLALVAQLGRYFYEKAIGLLAAGLGLVTPGFLFISSSLFSHTASLFGVTLTLVAVFHLSQSNRNQRIYAIGLGVALGATFVTRPFAAVGIGLAIAIFLLILLARREVDWKILAWITVSGLSISSLLPLFWQAIGGSPTFNPYLLVWPYDRIGFGPDIGPYGYTIHNAIFLSLPLKLTALGTGLFGWPGWTNLLFLPLPFLARRANRWDWMLLGTIFGMIFVYVFYWEWGREIGGFPRYYYDALPAFLLLTGRGICLSGQYLAKWHFRLRYVPLALVISFTVYSFIWTLPPLIADQKGKYDITSEPLRVVEQANLSEPALVMVKNVESWTDFAAPFAANSPTLNSPIIYAIDWGPEHTRRVRAQFQGRTCWELEGRQLKRCPK